MVGTRLWRRPAATASPYSALRDARGQRTARVGRPSSAIGPTTCPDTHQIRDGTPTLGPIVFVPLCTMRPGCRLLCSSTPAASDSMGHTLPSPRVVTCPPLVYHAGACTWLPSLRVEHDLVHQLVRNARTRPQAQQKAHHTSSAHDGHSLIFIAWLHVPAGMHSRFQSRSATARDNPFAERRHCKTALPYYFRSVRRMSPRLPPAPTGPARII